MPQFELDNRKLFGYTLLSFDSDGGMVKLNPIIESFTWSGDFNQSAMQLDVTLMSYPGTKDLVTYGDRLFLYVFDSATGKTITLFMGVVTDRTMTTGTSGNTRLVAHDMMFYLLKNRDDFVFRNMTATEILKSICTQFGIYTYSIADTKYKIPSLVSRNQSLYDAILQALIVTRDATGKKFFLRADERGINLFAKTDQPSKWVLEEGRTLLSANFSESIANMRNYVKVVSHAANDDRGVVQAEAKDKASIKKYGMLQQIQMAEQSGKDKSSASGTANEVLKKMNKVDRRVRIQAVAVHGLYPGDPVQVIESSTGLSGIFYVSTIRTTVSSASATIDVELAYDDDYDKSGPGSM